MQKIDLPIRGMTCGSCVAAIERGLHRVPGVQTAAVDLAAAKATVTYDPATAQVNDLIQAIEETAYEVKAARAAGGTGGMAHQPSTMQTAKQMLKMGACCAGPILGLALLAPLAGRLGIGVSSVVSFLLVLACPLSMLVMMYFMMRSQKAERQSQGQAEGPPLPQMTPAVKMAEGDGQSQGHEALYAPETRQPSAVSSPTMAIPKSSRPPG